MTEDEVRQRAFAVPLTNPAYPPGPYRFHNREYLTITYRTDPDVLRHLIPEPLEPDGDGLAKFEFMRMPDSTGFGHYCEAGQVAPVRFGNQRGAYQIGMYVNDLAPIAGGRELWGFPKKMGEPKLDVVKDTLIGTVDYNGIRVAIGTMGYKHKILSVDDVRDSLIGPNFLLKIIPHVDATPRICELVRYGQSDLNIKGAWSGPGALELFAHALAPVAELPVHEVVSTVHILTDLTLDLGEVVHDYLG
jgi:acetoacetate decarboxylase